MARRGSRRADPSSGPVLGDSRARVLEVLQTASTPLGIDEIAVRVGLHPNTLRFHLDGLADQGLVERRNEERDVPGRPRALYTALPNTAPAGQRSYRLLAEILTSYLASRTRRPEQAALEAGVAWGRFLIDRPAPFRRIDANTATEQLTDTLADIGFAPEPVTTGRKRQILLHHCPFREAAEQHGNVVCTVHLGLMRGMLGELDAQLTVERLEPFVEPNLCVTHLAARTRSRDNTAGRASTRTPAQTAGRDPRSTRREPSR